MIYSLTQLSWAIWYFTVGSSVNDTAQGKTSFPKVLKVPENMTKPLLNQTIKENTPDKSDIDHGGFSTAIYKPVTNYSY